MSDYESELADWKTRMGLNPKESYSPGELAMISEDRASHKKAWCMHCDKQLFVMRMKLVTRKIDPYVQIDDSGKDYIAPSKRIRTCPECFEELYGKKT